ASDWTFDRSPLCQTNPLYVDANRYVPGVPPGVTPITRGGGSSGSAVFSIYVPFELRELEKYVYVANPSAGYDEAVFLGARKRPDGKSRLVIIRDGHIIPEALPAGIRAYVVAPPNLLHGLSAPTITAKPYVRPQMNNGGRLTIVFLGAGITDPI